MTQNLAQFEKILARAHSNYLAQLSCDTIQGNNHINRLLAKITVVGVILVPMNIVTSIWGMNVKVPGMATTVDNYFFFGGILITLASWAILCTLFCRRAGLI